MAPVMNTRFLFALAAGFGLFSCGAATSRMHNRTPRPAGTAAAVDAPEREPVAQPQGADLERSAPEPAAPESSTPSAGVDGGRGGGPAPAAEEPRAAQPSGGRDLVAIVAGQDVFAADLLEAWMFRESPELRRYLDKLVLDKLVLAEAARMGVQLSPEVSRAALRESRANLEKEIADAGGGSVEEFVQRRLGMDPARYLERLHEKKLTDLLAERCVRGYLLGSERAEARMIVVSDRGDADQVSAALARGDDFGKVAKRFSLDPSSEDEGRLPPLVRAPSAISRLAFSTSVGEIGGPLFDEGKYLFLLVESRLAGIEGGWEALGPAVERSLAERPVEDLEFLQWQAEVLSVYDVDLRPFLELVGEPVE